MVSTKVCSHNFITTYLLTIFTWQGHLLKIIYALWHKNKELSLNCDACTSSIANYVSLLFAARIVGSNT
jgi:hypothetical protein